VLACSVVIPSYARPESLADCLDGLRSQERLPDEVVVVTRLDDHESREVALSAEGLHVVLADVRQPGLVAALNAGVVAASGPILAMIDDDAVPRPDWLRRILQTYATDARIAGVGGRDVVWEGGRIVGPPPSQHGDTVVGKAGRFGRVVGRHHLGVGHPRDVDVLKGANMSYRKCALLPYGFDARVRGRGSQPHNELSACLPIRRRGLRLVYDPMILVDHFPRPRPMGDHRAVESSLVSGELAFNETLSLWPFLRGWSRVGFVLWAVLVGTRSAPGLVQATRLMATGDAGGGARWIASVSSRAAAVRVLRREPRARITG
jgi:hypothetical protein